MYTYDQKPNTIFSEPTKEFMQKIRENDYVVLTGKNNCGKSFLLKTIATQLGKEASYLGPARYQNFNIIGNYSPDRHRNKADRKFQEFSASFNNQKQNIDNSPVNLQEAIAELTDDKRDQLFEIMEQLLGSKMELKYTVENNTMSQQYISTDGHNMSFTSSGYRLIITLITSLLNDDFDTYLIDEPELGISPETQGSFSDFLFDPKIREKYFPHIKCLVLATHSTIFLDHKTVQNNYYVDKVRDTIDVARIESVADINKLHFFLLGNRLETLYMPSVIVIVEGKSDYKYLNRVLNLNYRNSRISLLPANGDSRVATVLHTIKGILGDLQKSPYGNRIFTILDKVHGDGVVTKLKGMGVPDENLIVWNKNGIEYYYPENIMHEIFQCTDEISIDGDIISANNLSYTKNELVELVISKMSIGDTLPAEFKTEFMDKISILLPE